MAGVPLITRVTNNVRENLVSTNVARVNRDLLRVQEQLSSGYKINRPSDDPAAASRVIALSAQQSRGNDLLANIQAATPLLGAADEALGQAYDILARVRQLAVREASDTSTAETRANSGIEVEEALRNLLSVANRQVGGRYIFGGIRDDKSPFVEVAGDVRYRGHGEETAVEIAEGMTVEVNLSGERVFQASPVEIVGRVDMNPDLTRQTQLVDLNREGGVPRGVDLGRIRLADSAGSATVDLSSARNVGDVIDLIESTGLFGASLNDAGNGIRVASTTIGANGLAVPGLTVTDLDGHTAARDLGIAVVGDADGLFEGSDLDPALTFLTPLQALVGGAGLPQADQGPRSIRVTYGEQTVDVTVDPTGTVQDLVNAVERGVPGLEVTIDETRGRLVLTGDRAGARLRVDDVPVAGGPTDTTASALGLTTPLEAREVADLNNGRGVSLVEGPDITVTTRDGRVFSVDLSGARTVADIFRAIELATGGQVVGSTSVDGNGISLTDNTTPASPSSVFRVDDAAGSFAARDLGLSPPTGSTGNILTGGDLLWAGQGAKGLFSELIRLREALLSNDESGIVQAMAGLEQAQPAVLDARAEVGGRQARMDFGRERLEDQDARIEELLTDTRGVDLARAVVDLQDQQQVLQAAFGAASTLFGTSLMDFLR